MKRSGIRGFCLLLFGTIAMLAAVLLLAPQAVEAAPTNFYVSTTGNDTTGNGTAGNPWASMEKARDYIRTNNLNLGMTDDIIVNLAPGTYNVASTIVFTDADSGSNGHYVIYKSSGVPGSAHLVGSQQITSWTLHAGNIYKSYVGTGWTFNTLYENDKRSTMARYPNRTSTKSSFAPYLSSEGVAASKSILQYKAADMNPAGWDLSDAQVVIWSGDKYDWFTDTVPITSVDTATRQLTLAHDTTYHIYGGGSLPHQDGSRYFIQGSLDLLDQPGEFYLDSSTGYLYYWARDGAIGSQSIRAPKMQTILSVQGASETVRASYLQFEGLTVEQSDFPSWYATRNSTAPANAGMIDLQNTDHIAILSTNVKNSGLDAIRMLGYNQNNTVSSSSIEHTGHYGIHLHGKTPGTPGTSDVNKNNLFTNNHIGYVGELVGHGAGVYLESSGGNEISYSTIHDSPRYLITWNSPSTGLANNLTYTKNNVFKYLKLYNGTQDSGDTGSVYSFSSSRNTVPYNANTVEQVTVDNGYADPSVTDYAPNGVFMDLDTYGQIFTNMKVTNMQGTAYRQTITGNHTMTNVSWLAGFNDSLMDYANIGFSNTFPYGIAPGNLTAVVAGAQVDLAWSSVNNAASYKVKRSTTPGGPYSTTVCTGVTTLSCSDTTASPGVTYYYVATSVTAAGVESDHSNEAFIFGNFAGLAESFEAGFGSWSTVYGSPSASSTQAHAGANSFAVNQDQDVIRYAFPAGLNQAATVWFYDDAADTTSMVGAFVDDSATAAFLGVNTVTSSSKYVYRIGGTWTASAVNRSTGWHELKFDYTSGTDLNMYIDGTLVNMTTAVTFFTHIDLGDAWANGITSSNYFDDVKVSSQADGFEAGFTQWATQYGTANTSTAQAHRGTNSYVLNEDRELIQHLLSGSWNKTVKVWFYDDAADTSLCAGAFVDNTTTVGFLGACTTVSATKYAYRIGSTWTATAVNRTTGWHELKFDYTSGTNVKLSIDGTLVHTSTSIASFNHITLGDAWADGNSGNVYFDDLLVE